MTHAHACRKDNMSVYTDICEAHYSSLEGKLKPMLCDECRGEYSHYGECPRCLRAYAENKEYLQTHTFITSDYLCEYHTNSHNAIKGVMLRLPHEHPRQYYGIELEIEFDYDRVRINNCDCDDDYDDCDDEDYDINAILAEFTKITDGLFVYEKDGSLENGVEFISRPCSYKYWTHEDTVNKLKDGMEYLRRNGALIEQPTGNGFHIHISNKFFDKAEQGMTPYRNFDWLFQKFQPELEHLGRRHYTNYCASKVTRARNLFNANCGLEGVEYTVKGKLRRDRTELPHGDHGVAVTLSGPTTEARVFKSTTDYKEILATIEIVRNLAHASRDNDIDHTLDELLHTKPNLYLDEYIQKAKLQTARKKEKLELDKMNTNEIEFELEV